MVPNTAVEDGDEDANYFQHVPYLDNFNAERGTHLVSAAGAEPPESLPPQAARDRARIRARERAKIFFFILCSSNLKTTTCSE